MKRMLIMGEGISTELRGMFLHGEDVQVDELIRGEAWKEKDFSSLM